MDTDAYGIVYNSEKTYQHLAVSLQNTPMVIAWTDMEGSQYDILFTLRPFIHGPIQGGIKNSYLFVSVMRIGAFAFDTSSPDFAPRYVGEKLGVMSEPLTDLINGVLRNLRSL